MHNIIGKKVNRIDGYEKVTGKAIYGDDIELPGMLYGVCRYSDIPAGKIKHINLEKARAYPGVVQIATYQDIPGITKVGPAKADYLPIVKDEVFFVGDVIAVIAAETMEAASKAADLIEVEYEPFHPVTHVKEAIKPESRRVHDDEKNNVLNHHHVDKGDWEKGLELSDQVIEREFTTGFQEHAYIEPESVIGIPDPYTDGIIIKGSVQNAHKVQGFVAQFMAMDESKINVQRSVMGGSFGGKDDIIDHLSCRVALMTKLTNRPIKFTYNREQSIRESSKRHPYTLNYKVGFNNNGRIQAMKIEILADVGPYAVLSPFVTWRSVVTATGPYQIEHVRTDITGIYTNNNYSSALRGFGSPQVCFAVESLIDEIGEICNLNPVEVRSLNALKQGGVTATGQKFDNHIVSVEEVMEKAVRESQFLEKFKSYPIENQTDKRFKKGIGLSVSYRGCSLGAEGADFSSAIVTVHGDGSINVSTAVSENGQGLQTTMAIIVSEVLGQKLEDITFIEPGTSNIVDGGGTVASRATLMGGSAVKDAAEQIKARLFPIVKEKLSVSEIEDTVWKDGVIRTLSGEKSISFNELANTAKFSGIQLSANGWHNAPEITWDEEKGKGNPYFTWVYACQIVDLTADTSTGKLFIEKVTAAHDVGKAINRVGVEGQITGGVMQGLGYGLMEDYNIENGEIKSENFDSYLLPTIRAIGEIVPIVVENDDPAGPFGAKSLGEPTNELTAGALNNAVSHAVGKRNYNIPLTLEQVFLGYNLKKPTRMSELSRKEGQTKQVFRLSDIEVVSPPTLKDALEILSDNQHKIITGGTDVLIKERGIYSNTSYVDLSCYQELQNIKEDKDWIEIGGAVPFTKIVQSELIQNHFPILVEASKTVGSRQLRNRATLAGNIANAAVAADGIPPLMVYGAEMVLLSKRGERRVKLEDFIIKGYKTAIEPDEIIAGIRIHKLPDKTYFYHYFKLGRRGALNITRISISALVSFDADGKIEDCRICDGALFYKPLRFKEIEKEMKGHKLDEAIIASSISKLDHQIEEAIGKRWSAAYKKPVFLNMFQDALEAIKNLENKHP